MAQATVNKKKLKRSSNLFEKIVTFENLYLAAKKALKGKHAKNTASSFYFNLENEIIELQEKLASGEYRPGRYHQFHIYEPKPREICSSEFKGRVVHHAICYIIEPILENTSISDSFACRHGKGAHRAVKRAQLFSRKYDYFLKCDIKKFFFSIHHEVLKSLLRKKIKDKKLLNLMDIIIDHEVPGNPKGVGIPIGNLTSQHFANFYLGELDHFIKDRLSVNGYVRYMDDFISFGDSKEMLWQLHDAIDTFVKEKLKMQLKIKAMRVSPVKEGIPFLGFRIYPHLIRLKRENLVRLRKKIKNKELAYESGNISQKDLVLSVSSLIAHASHADSGKLRGSIFEASNNLA